MKTLNGTRRLLATLTTPPVRPHPNPLLPPYAHSLPTARDPIMPPYSHSLDHRVPSHPQLRGEWGLRAQSKFTVLPASSLDANTNTSTNAKSTANKLEEGYRQWAERMLATEAGRGALWQKWIESVEALSSPQSHIPQIAFHELSEHLASGSTIDAIHRAGSLVLRDVISDDSATGAAREVLQAMEERDGRPVFWHKALLSLRGDPSVLSASRQIMRALRAEREEPYILADTIYEGVPLFQPSTSLNPWTSSTSSPISASLALTPMRLRIPSSSAAAAYATIAPLIRSKQSKISFYEPFAYLSPSNHRLIEAAELEETTLQETRLAHLDTATREVTVEAGDVVYHLSSLPVSAVPDEQGIGGLSLPVSPILRSSEEGQRIVRAQRSAFEAGSPPPIARVGEQAVELEQPGNEEGLGGYGARKAMGY